MYDFSYINGILSFTFRNILDTNGLLGEQVTPNTSWHWNSHPNYFIKNWLSAFKMFQPPSFPSLPDALFCFTSIPNALFELFVLCFYCIPLIVSHCLQSFLFWGSTLRNTCHPASLLEFPITLLSRAHPAASIDFLSLSPAPCSFLSPLMLTPSAPSCSICHLPRFFLSCRQ